MKNKKNIFKIIASVIFFFIERSPRMQKLLKKFSFYLNKTVELFKKICLLLLKIIIFFFLCGFFFFLFHWEFYFDQMHQAYVKFVNYHFTTPESVMFGTYKLKRPPIIVIVKYMLSILWALSPIFLFVAAVSLLYGFYLHVKSLITLFFLYCKEKVIRLLYFFKDLKKKIQYRIHLLYQGYNSTVEYVFYTHGVRSSNLFILSVVLKVSYPLAHKLVESSFFCSNYVSYILLLVFVFITSCFWLAFNGVKGKTFKDYFKIYIGLLVFFLLIIVIHGLLTNPFLVNICLILTISLIR